MRPYAVLLAVLLVAAGCTKEAPAAQDVRPVSTTVPPTPAAPQVITLAFGGDVHFTGRTLRLLDDPATAFGPIAETLRAADFAMVNLETPVTERGTPEVKEYVFQSPPAAFDALRAAGVDAASVANNHGLDYGRVGFADTLAYASSAGFPVVGGGVDAAAAYAPWYTTVDGVRIAVFAFTQVGPANSDWRATDSRPGLAYMVSSAQIAAAADAIQLADKRADVVIVFMHWGIERDPCPTAQQESTAQAFADAGASIVVGAHPHIPQGMGWLDDTFVAYSLGNFVWYSDTSNPDTGVLQLTLTDSVVTDVAYVPATVSRQTGQPMPVSGGERDRILAKLDGLRSCTNLAPNS